MRLAYGADSPLWRQYLHTLLAMLHPLAAPAAGKR
jgi:peptide/nickel transport system permease protein